MKWEKWWGNCEIESTWKIASCHDCLRVCYSFDKKKHILLAWLNKCCWCSFASYNWILFIWFSNMSEFLSQNATNMGIENLVVFYFCSIVQSLWYSLSDWCGNIHVHAFLLNSFVIDSHKNVVISFECHYIFYYSY